jgi:hypothetical protein
MTRHAFDETEHDRVRPADAGTAGLALFDEPPCVLPGWAQTWASLTETERRAQRDRWKQQLLPLVLDLAARPQGVTASEVLTAGAEASILWTERSFVSRHPRIYSFLGGWLGQLAKQGKLAPKTARVEGHGTIHLRRDSERKLSHDNDGLIYVDAGRVA